MCKESSKHKFQYGDIVYIICYLPLNYNLGKIVKFDEEKNMYVMIHFLDNCDPESFWCWCYVKEEDIDFASKIFGDPCYENVFVDIPKLNSSNFLELYTETYDLAEQVYEGKLTPQEFCKKAIEIYENEKKNKNKK